MQSHADLAERYRSTRALTEALAEPLSAEDQTVQSMPDVSPTKWHRAHTTWFFETFILESHLADFAPYDAQLRYLFNSYYEGIGPQFTRAMRGLVSRPGAAEVGKKVEWPSWKPTPEMIERNPKAYKKYEDGMEGGPRNPLGARAIYLYQNGRDTAIRIHGTTEPNSIGHSVSIGCIRIVNDHVIDLYNRVAIGASVMVY